MEVAARCVLWSVRRFSSNATTLLAKSATFEAIGVKKDLCSRLKLLGITLPTWVQQEAVPVVAMGKHPVLIKAETGSGKTLSYLLPVLQNLTIEKPWRAVVVVPTRELAVQTASMASQLVTPEHRVRIGLYANGMEGIPDQVSVYVPIVA